MSTRPYDRIEKWREELARRTYADEYEGGMASTICLRFFKGTWHVLTVRKIRDGETSGTSFLVGGRVEICRDSEDNIVGETPQEAGARELFEEGGYFFCPDELCHTHEVLKTHTGAPYKQYFFVCLFEDGTPFEGTEAKRDEVEESAWVPLLDTLKGGATEGVFSSGGTRRAVLLDRYNLEGLKEALEKVIKSQSNEGYFFDIFSAMITQNNPGTEIGRVLSYLEV